jgi:4-hydroxy-tetrahydrodipicolinate synthase
VTRPLVLGRGLHAVLPTAFHEDGRLDLPGTIALVGAQVQAGVAGLTVLGVMGEAAELTDEERAQVVSSVVAHAGVPVIVGATGASAAIVTRRVDDARRLGASAVMVSPTTDLGLHSLLEIVERAEMPLVIQDYPPASGVQTAVDDLVRAAGRPIVAGVKVEAPPTTGKIAAIREIEDPPAAMGGLGALFLIDELRAGATGVMTGFALPESLVAIIDEFNDDPESAEADWAHLLPLMRLEAFAPFSLAARKEVWRLRGVIGSARCRRAGAVLDDRGREDVRRAYLAVRVAARTA